MTADSSPFLVRGFDSTSCGDIATTTTPPIDRAVDATLRRRPVGELLDELDRAHERIVGHLATLTRPGCLTACSRSSPPAPIHPARASGATTDLGPISVDFDGARRRAVRRRRCHPNSTPKDHMTATDPVMYDPPSILGADLFASTLADRTLHALVVHRMLASDQVHRVMSPGSTIDATYYRLGQLHHDGLAEAFGVRSGRRAQYKVWHATAAGVDRALSDPDLPSRYVVARQKPPGTFQRPASPSNEAGLAFISHARRNPGHECDYLAWEHKVAPSLGAERRGAPNLIADAVLSYTVAEPHRPSHDLRPAGSSSSTGGPNRRKCCSRSCAATRCTTITAPPAAIVSRGGSSATRRSPSCA